MRQSPNGPGEWRIGEQGLASQALIAYAPVSERARRVVSKLRQAPRLIQAARDNIKDPPGIFVKAGVETLQGTLSFIEEHLLRAFAGLDDLHLLGDLADASSEAARAVRHYLGYLQHDLAPRARASFRLGRERFAEAAPGRRNRDDARTAPRDRDT